MRAFQNCCKIMIAQHHFGSRQRPFVAVEQKKITMSGSNRNSEHGTLHEWGASGKKQNLKHTFKYVWNNFSLFLLCFFVRLFNAVMPRSGTLRGKNRLKLMTIAKKTLGTGDIAAAVRLPEGEDKNEWFAMHVVDFYNEISLLYGIVAEIDTAERFPVMGAGKQDFGTARTQCIHRPKP